MIVPRETWCRAPFNSQLWESVCGILHGFPPHVGVADAHLLAVVADQLESGWRRFPKQRTPFRRWAVGRFDVMTF